MTAALITVPNVCNDESQLNEEIGTQFGSSYYTFFAQFVSVLAAPLIEATDDELLCLFEKSGAFAFWNSPEEDIYTVKDGSAS